jgi:protease YdgD
MTINDHFFGRDDRVRVNAREAPWTYMGRITNSHGESCTATLVARDVLVTAAHCIHAENQVATGASFTAENGGAQANAVAYMISPQFNYERFSTTNEIDGLDWALVRLDRPLGAQLGFAGVRSLSGQTRAAARAADLYQAGYSWDTGQTLSGNVACHLIEFYPDNTFSHQCDTTQGDSGSAFLVRNGRGYDVIGVDSNYRENPDGPVINIAVGAVAFQRYVADFTAGRIGTRFGADGGKPKRD